MKNPDFVPTAKTETLQISAFSEEDRFLLKQKMEQVIISEMKFYQVEVPSTEGKLLAQLKNDTILRELAFEEEKDMYLCKGYVLNDHQILGQINQYSI
jgi:GTP-binding protein HflX